MSIEKTWVGLPSFQPIVLAKEGDDEVRIEANWGCIERLERNILRVSLAAGLSTAGALLAGFVPTIGGIFAGGALSGIGNGASTWLAWEKSDQYFLEARLIEDFPAIFERAKAINQYLDDVIHKMQGIYSTTLPEITPIEAVDTIEEDAALCSLGRKQRNAVRLFTAGNLSAAGGLLGGFVQTPAGIIGGAILGGIGNGVSTWLAFEQSNDATIHTSASEGLPHQFKKLNDCASMLLDLVETIKKLNPECLMFEEDLKPVNCEEDSSSCINSRYLRNFTYVNVAGWMSSAGGWLSGYWPHPAGIIIGGGLASAANAISTWLAWEKVNDKEMEKTAVKLFPELVLTVDEISRKLIALSTLTKTCSEIKDLPSTVLEI